MNITIVNTSTGIKKVCTFDDFAIKGAWAVLRYPRAGLWAFSLKHGGMESKRGEHAKWRIVPADLAILLALAKEKKIKIAKTPRADRPKRPRAAVKQQPELFR